jgi:uncharacterized protein YciI
MKFFVIEITYRAPLTEIDRALSAHRQFLQNAYDQNRLLLSGPQNPRIGGIIIARGQSLDEVQAFFAGDPYQMAKLASYRYIEFAPVKHLPAIANWVGDGTQTPKP